MAMTTLTLTPAERDLIADQMRDLIRWESDEPELAERISEARSILSKLA